MRLNRTLIDLIIKVNLQNQYVESKVQYVRKTERFCRNIEALENGVYRAQPAGTCYEFVCTDAIEYKRVEASEYYWEVLYSANDYPSRLKKGRESERRKIELESKLAGAIEPTGF